MQDVVDDWKQYGTYYGLAHSLQHLYKYSVHLFLTVFLAEGLGNTFGYLDKFRAPYLAMPIFSNGQDFAHSRPFGWLTIIRSLIETNCMKLTSISNSSALGNLYLIVCNLENQIANVHSLLWVFLSSLVSNSQLYISLYSLRVFTSLWGFPLVIKVLLENKLFGIWIVEREI